MRKVTCSPDRPAQYRPCRCGWLTSGIGCRRPCWRDTWAAINGNGGNGPGPQAEPEARPAGADLPRRAEAAQRPLTPERARQLALSEDQS